MVEACSDLEQESQRNKACLADNDAQIKHLLEANERQAAQTEQKWQLIVEDRGCAIHSLQEQVKRVHPSSA